MSQILQRNCGFEGRKVKAEIGSQKHIDSLEEVFSHDSINYFEVGGVVMSTSNFPPNSEMCFSKASLSGVRPYLLVEKHVS